MSGPDRMEDLAPSRPLRHLRRRPFYGWWLALLGLVSVLLALPWLPATVAYHLLLADAKAATLVLIAVGLGYRAARARPGGSRLLLTGLAAGISCWALGWVIFSIELWYGRAIGIDLIEEALHGLYFLILLWTLDRLENRPPRGFAPVFVLAMFSYLVLLPALVAPREYDNWAPTFLFFLFLDAYVALRCYLLALRTGSPQLARLLRTTTLAFSAALLIDALDWALFAGWYQPSADDRWSALVLLALLPLLQLASPGRWRQRRRALACPVWVRGLLHPLAPFLLLALFPLFIHLIGYGAGVLLEPSRAARDLFLVAWLLVIALVLARHLLRAQSVSGSDSNSNSAWLSKLQPTALPLSVQMPGPDPVRATVAEPLPQRPLAARADPLLQRLDQVLASRFGETELDLGQLADAMAMSPRQLQRRLKAAADISPADYLRRYRLQQAARLLAEGNKVTWVAQAVGFAHQSHFGRCFKQQYGLTPGEYQQGQRATVERETAEQIATEKDVEATRAAGTNATIAVLQTPLS